MRDYQYEEAEVIVKEMMDQLCLDMTAHKYVTDSVSLFVGYSLSQGVFGTGGTVRLTNETNAAGVIVPAVAKLYRRVTNPTLAIRRIGLSCNDVQEDRDELQLNMFEDVTKQLRKETLQETMLEIRAKYGKNSILKGMNYEEAATGRERNEQIGGIKVGKASIRVPMPIKMRAKQFAMFDALTGLAEAIAERERQYETKKEMTAERIEEINSLLISVQPGDTVTICYYCEYGRQYRKLTGKLKKVDCYWKELQIEDISINFSEILDLQKLS